MFFFFVIILHFYFVLMDISKRSLLDFFEEFLN